MLVGLMACNPSSKEKNLPYQNTIDSLIVAKGEFNGVVLITTDGNVDYSKSFGFSNIEKEELLDTNDQFVIGSVSKQITAVLVLQAYERGAIKLSDNLRAYLPDLVQSWADSITIHHLLTHTHGITDLEKPLSFKPGTQFRYSQLGFELLSLVLESVTGKSFANLADSLFDHHGLSNTSHPDSGYDRLVNGYTEQPNGQIQYDSTSLKNFVAAGSFISTSEDLSLWNTLLHNGSLLNDSTFKLMTKRYATRQHPIFGEVEYGYGLLFKRGESKTLIGALGYSPGFVSANYYFPQTKTSVVVLENVARNLDDFKQTFYHHLEIIDIVRKRDVALKRADG